MTIYLFDKRIYKVESVNAMTEKQAAAEYSFDYTGAVLQYSDLNEFSTDFNNRSFKPGDFYVKICN